MRACRDVHLFWGGVAFGGLGGGADEGWLSRLSVDAEASLALLRALAVHAADATPGVPLSKAETRCTRDALREAQASLVVLPGKQGAKAFSVDDDGSSEVECDDAEASTELRRSLSPPLAAAATAARSEWAAQYGSLTARTPGLAVLVAEARSGLCRAATGALGLPLGGVRLFTAASQAAPDWSGNAVGGDMAASLSDGLRSNGGDKGGVVDVSLDAPLASAADAAHHIRRAYSVATGSGPSRGPSRGSSTGAARL